MSKSEKRRLNQFIAIRCTAEEKQLIVMAANSTGHSVSEFVRWAAMRRAEEVVRTTEGGAA